MFKYIKYFFFFLLTFLLGAQTTYAKTELVLPQNRVVFSIEQNQSFNSLEKEQQPNIGFLKEKTKFVAVQYNSAVKPYNFSESFSEGLANGVDDLAGAWKMGWNKQRILDLPKGSRPQVTDYLNQSYIDAHIAKFDDGAVRFTSRNSFNTYSTLGPDGGFVLSKNDFDRIIQETGGDLRQIEQRVGLDANYLDGNDVMIVFLDNPNVNGLRLPTGNEGGANQFWLPGGKTSGGVNEAVMDFSNSPSYTEIILE